MELFDPDPTMMCCAAISSPRLCCSLSSSSSSAFSVPLSSRLSSPWGLSPSPSHPNSTTSSFFADLESALPLFEPWALRRSASAASKSTWKPSWRSR